MISSYLAPSTFPINQLTENTRFVATTLHGLEEVLASELLALGARDIEKLRRAVAFKGDLGFMYKANLSLRTALRILFPIAQFEAGNERHLYDNVNQLAWEEFMDVDETLAIDAVLNTDLFRHSQFVAQKTKDAIADRFRTKYKKRPSVDLRDPHLRINIHIHDDRVTLSLDSSGDLLYKRGYRGQTGVAPLNEVLAAGMILLSGWDGKTPFCDPMTGSGTLATEAALIAGNIPPGYFRSTFGFMRWRNFDEPLWNTIYDAAIKKISPPAEKLIFASDASANNLKKAKQNFRAAQVDDLIAARTSQFQELEKPAPRGVLIMNPPYGERMSKDDSAALYRSFGDALKKNWTGWQAWLISSNLEAIKKIGLQASKKIVLYNGALECRYLRYEMYEGTRK